MHEPVARFEPPVKIAAYGVTVQVGVAFDTVTFATLVVSRV
jgi:hypothetical protein